MTNSKCTECGSFNIKVARRYGSRIFCTKCYTRYFKYGECYKCGRLEKLPTFKRYGICIKCERDVPCATCGKKEYSIGAITSYGPVCQSCSTKVRPLKKCEKCGELSTVLSRHAHLKHDLKVCLKCSRENNGTCEACGRNRPLYKDSDGAKICKKCMFFGEVQCKKCGANMPAGYGKICKECYWSGLLSRKVDKAKSHFDMAVMAAEFKYFSIWLQERLGSNVASNKINSYLNFFLKLESIWGYIPVYSQLVDQFGAGGLRKFELPIKWMVDQKELIIDLKYKEESTEFRRIDDLINSLSCNEVNKTMLLQYKKHIFDKIKSGKTTVRSARLAIRPAVSLVNSCDINNSSGVLQDDLDSYLIQKPGQKSAITGYVNFINDNFSQNIDIKVNEKKPKPTKEKTWRR